MRVDILYRSSFVKNGQYAIVITTAGGMLYVRCLQHTLLVRTYVPSQTTKLTPKDSLVPLSILLNDVF